MSYIIVYQSVSEFAYNNIPSIDFWYILYTFLLKYNNGVNLGEAIQGISRQKVTLKKFHHFN